MRIAIDDDIAVTVDSLSLTLHVVPDVLLVGEVSSDEYRALLALLIALAWRPRRRSWKLQQILPVEVERDLGTVACVIGCSWTAYVQHPEKQGKNVCVDLLVNNERVVRIICEAKKAREGVERLLQSMQEAGLIGEKVITN